MNLQNIIDKEVQENAAYERKTAEEQMPSIEADFIKSFGIAPDGMYYDQELERIVVHSGDLEIVRTSSYWSGVTKCPMCGKKLVTQSSGASSARNLSFEVPYWHKHEPEAIERLRSALQEILTLE
jgi:hypothetical protein